MKPEELQEEKKEQIQGGVPAGELSDEQMEQVDGGCWSPQFCQSPKKTSTPIV